MTTTITTLSGLGVSHGAQTFAAKTPGDYPAVGALVEEFDLFQQGYAGAVVTILRAGTTTLMPCYSDPLLTEAVDNPQVLVTKTDALGNTYGKFLTSVYVPYAYELDISTTERTGVQGVPLTSLDGEVGDSVLVTATSSTNARTLSKRAADQVRFLDFGDVSTSAAANTATLVAAIAAGASRGSARVLLPTTVIPFHAINLPGDVILEGDGDGCILQSVLSDKVITVTGDRAGLCNLQLDGINLIDGSIGIYAKARDFLLLDTVEIRRFDKNMRFQGGQNHVWRSLDSKNANYCVEILGDTDSTGSGNGDEFSGLDWLQGEVSESTQCGLMLRVIDAAVRHNSIAQVDFLDNVGTQGAIHITGASWQYFKQVYFDGNEQDLFIDDNMDIRILDRQVSNIYFEGGQIEGGTLNFDGLCEDVIFDGMELNNAEFSLATPDNPILIRDCVEYLTLFSGESTKAIRYQTTDFGSVKGATTNGTATTVSKLKVASNEVVQLTVNVTAEQQNGAGFADWMYVMGARSAPATLAYDAQTGNYTVGSTVQGVTSGAQAIITADSDGGTTGTLSLAAVQGVFLDNEIIKEVTGSGSATVNGTITEGTVSLISTATELRATGSDTGAPPAGWAVTFVALGHELLTKVTGAAATDIAWNIRQQATIL